MTLSVSSLDLDLLMVIQYTILVIFTRVIRFNLLPSLPLNCDPGSQPLDDKFPTNSRI